MKKSIIATAAVAAGVVAALGTGAYVAQAHEHHVYCKAGVLSADLTNYPDGSSVKAVYDGAVVLDQTFGRDGLHPRQPVDPSTEHTYSVTVVGSDGVGSFTESGTTTAACGYTVPTPTPTEEPSSTPTTTPPTSEPTSPPKPSQTPTSTPSSTPTSTPSKPAPQHSEAPSKPNSPSTKPSATPSGAPSPATTPSVKPGTPAADVPVPVHAPATFTG